MAVKVTKSKGPALCREFVKSEALVLTICGKRLEFDTLRCPDRADHMMKYKTGFCGNGYCEGTAKKSASGKPAPTCKWWKTCPCKCHSMFDQMFTMSEMPRILVDNSAYSPEHGDFKIPSLEERMRLTVLSKPNRDDVPIIIESPLPDAVPVTIAHVFTPTATGRAARGELESWVKDACDVWLVEDTMTPMTDYHQPCTPPYLAKEIASTQGMREPSVGAIDAVLKRWVVLGFAVIAAKPTRFTEYTIEGIKSGLEGCKDKAKRSKRMASAASARGALR